MHSDIHPQTNDYKVSIIPLFRDVMTFKGIAGRPGGAPPARLDAKEYVLRLFFLERHGVAADLRIA